MDTLRKIFASKHLKDVLAGGQKTADFGGKLARILAFALPGSGIELSAATALVSGSAQAALAATGRKGAGKGLNDRDAYAAIYTTALHAAYLKAIFESLEDEDFGGLEPPTVEEALPSLADATADLAYSREQLGSFRQDHLFNMYGRYLSRFLSLPRGDQEIGLDQKKLKAVREAAIQNFDEGITKDDAGGWVFRLELRQDIRALKEQNGEILKGTNEFRQDLKKLAASMPESKRKDGPASGQERDRTQPPAGQVNQVSRSQGVVIGDHAQQNNYFITDSQPPEIDLAEAASLLESMPTHQVAPLGHIPKHSRFNYERNPHFVGRTDELIKIATALKKGESLVVVPKLVASGMGGIGKTQLAVEFVHRYGQFFLGGVFWLNMENAAQVSTEVLACGDAMGLTKELESLPEDKRVGRVLREWQAKVPRLLVFDNCEEVELLKKWAPASGGCRVLVTSRMQDWERKGQVPCLPIATLPREKSLELLFELAPRLSGDPETADAIAEFVGDLPLALHLAGSYLATFNLTEPSEYLEELKNVSAREFHASLEGEEATWSPTKHDVSVCRTFMVSWKRLDRTNPIDNLAFQILACAICFAPSLPIPRWLLLRCAERNEIGKSKFQKGLNRLLDLGLLSSTAAETVQIHNLVAAFVKHQGEGLESRELVEGVIQNETDKINGSGDPRAMKTWVGHVVEVTDFASRKQSEQAPALASTLGFWFHLSGQYSKSRPYLEQALAINQKALGENHTETATSLNNLGHLLQAVGELNAARPYYEQALAINQKVLGENHPETATSLNNLGNLLQAVGELNAARPFYGQALAIRKAVLGDNHPDTAQSLNNLGSLLDSMGELKAARPYYEKALAIRKAVLGDNHPDTAGSLNNLGALLISMGELKAARLYFEQALAILQKVLGDIHPDTATSLNNLGSLLQAMGKLNAARPYYEQALAIRKAILGDNHPDTAASLNNLGYLLQAMGKLNAARPYYEQALAIRKAALGDNHPNTATSLNNLGYLLQAMGELNAARPYYEQALAINQKVLGENHPDTAASLNNLGYLLQAMGKLNAARPYYEQALAIRKAVLGDNHPGTARSLNNLAYLLQEMGELNAAQSYYEQALAINQKVLGENHPDTARSLNNLAYLLQEMGELNAAQSYYEQALAINQKVLGENHPDTARSLNNLGFLFLTQGDFQEAHHSLVQAHSNLLESLGEKHPETLQAARNLKVVTERVKISPKGAHKIAYFFSRMISFFTGSRKPK